jgi:plastocyanin
MKTILSTAALGLALLAGFAHAAPTATTSTSAASYGETARAEAADRTIVVKPGAAVNVTNGETVTFIVGEKSFTFHFQTYSSTQSLPLAAIAPADVNAGSVRVYVAASPLYQN